MDMTTTIRTTYYPLRRQDIGDAKAASGTELSSPSCEAEAFFQPTCDNDGREPIGMGCFLGSGWNVD
jgi:hypothetical protein